MLQLPRVGWRLLAFFYETSPDCLIVVVVVSECVLSACMSTSPSHAAVTETN